MHEKLGGAFVRDIEREVGDNGQAPLAEVAQAGEVAGKHASGLLLGHEREDAHFIGLLNPRRGGSERATGRADKRDRLAILPEVGAVGIEAPLAKGEDRAQLIERPDENVEDRSGGGLAACRIRFRTG